MCRLPTDTERHCAHTRVAVLLHHDELLASGHASRQSLEIYSRIALADAQDTYEGIIDQFPV